MRTPLRTEWEPTVADRFAANGYVAIVPDLLSAKHGSTEAVGEAVLRQLRDLDQVAYIRFASVYRQFADLDELRKAVETLS